MNIERYVKSLKDDLKKLKKEKQTKSVKERINMIEGELSDFSDD